MHHILNLQSAANIANKPTELQHLPSLDTTVHTLFYPHDPRFLNNTADLTSFYIETLEYIKTKNITAIYSGNDLGSLISAVIAEHFEFVGPSVESVFLCTHKQLTKQVTNAPIASKLWDITTAFPQTPYPFYLKAPYSSFGSLGFLVQNEADLKRAQVTITAHLQELNRPFFSILEQTTIPQKYPEALQNCMLIEPVVQKPQLTIEGFVYKNKVVPLILTDTNFQGNSNRFGSFTTPSKLSESLQRLVQQQVIRDITKIGLTNTFFNAEYWIDEETNDVLLIEVNSRTALSFRDLYRNAWGYDLQLNLATLALGLAPATVEQPIGVAGQYNVFTSDVQSYEKLLELPKKVKKCKLLVTAANQKVAHSDHGTLAAQFEVYGSKLSDITEQAEQLINDLD